MSKKVQENITFFHKDISFTGKVAGDEAIAVAGHMEGTIQTSQDLSIEKTGTVKADIKAASVTVSGALVGNVDSKGVVSITKTGRMVGDVKASQIIIQSGAQYKGSVITKASSAGKKSQQISRKPASGSKTKR